MSVPPPSSMVQKTLADDCLVVEALGPKSKERFISDFINDQLQEYEELYNPSPAAMAGAGSGKKKKQSKTTTGAAGSSSQSFKKSDSDVISSNHSSTTATNSPNRGSGNCNGSNNSNNKLDTVENRFTWYRNKLRSLQHDFANVFPPQWNVQYRLTVQFLQITARHIKFILKKYYNKNRAYLIAKSKLNHQQNRDKKLDGK